MNEISTLMLSWTFFLSTVLLVNKTVPKRIIFLFLVSWLFGIIACFIAGKTLFTSF